MHTRPAPGPRRTPPLLRWLALVTALLVAAPAHGQIGGATQGVWGDVGVGLGAGDRPFTPGVGWTVALGGFVGRYDSSFAVGRRMDFGVRVRQDAWFADGREALRTAPMLEARRGIDLLVVAVRFGGVAGPLLETPLHEDGPTRVVGGTLRAAGVAAWRFSPAASLGARLEVGVDVAHLQAQPTLSLTVGVEFARPVRAKAASSTVRRPLPPHLGAG